MDRREQTNSESTSQISEFVGATQFSNEDVDLEFLDKEVNTQQTMQFLRDSWENMVEEEDGDQRLLEPIHKTQAPLCLKMVTSKPVKKKSKAQRGSYGTRSKVGLSKKGRQSAFFGISRVWLIPPLGYNDSLGALEKNDQVRLDEALKRQDWFWHEKDRVTLPLEDKEEFLIWSVIDSECLYLMESFLFKSKVFPRLHWANLLWSKDILPSSSLVSWRLMHNKSPTYDNLRRKGCNFP
ncbi:hypothetical protein KIW84_071560 [Lathyrus oleraceus]|uniref:Uncharacterized protein n=1 Tax=Pisum sativum TaxID=3888 RepID=A0A9D4VJ24_PEA|nr:hypothetical protein KIW84_071560 [Pisum sativum]